MDAHDPVKQLSELFSSSEAIKRISPRFSELSLDIKEIAEYSKDPVFLAVLLFKLAEERDKTNKMLEQVVDKFDAIMLRLKTGETPAFEGRPAAVEKTTADVLPEQDRMILHLAQAQGRVTAAEIQSELGYKGKNAASQRLNRLFREGHLRKMQSGRNVLYLARNNLISP
ncbi:MAG: hypothetical protein NTW59_02970 [Candidatus Diapherotrites archaeon]|nr:hypothetical protein [Candidatus Diapherotrites archaeon]